MQTQTDKRYRIAVFLSRSDRPEVAKWYCPQCRNYLVELTGAKVTHISDLATLDSTPGVGVRCSGSIEPGKKCHLYVYFILGER